ncbi:hypothetical protein ADL22_08540 [Streptomyces sp. NRRL F-4489]|nr:hypothetical protein ADL22_08540 [Streptomyces sp. NRRL F-4489]
MSTVYIFGLLTGVILICSGRASVPEATGYVTPFLLIHERMATQLRAAPQYSNGVRHLQQPIPSRHRAPGPLGGRDDRQ